MLVGSGLLFHAYEQTHEALRASLLSEARLQITSGERSALIPKQPALAGALSFDPDLHWLVTTGKHQGMVSVLALDAPQALHDIPMAGAFTLRFSPDGRWLFVRGRDDNTLLEVGTWKVVARSPSGGEIYGDHCFAFSADSTRLAVSVANDSLHVLSVPDMRLVVKLTPPRNLDFRRVVFGANGTKLWAMGVMGRMFQWDLGQLQSELKQRGIVWKR